ncbi:MAG: Serine/threonine-protein kinase pkn1 [Betaproteobacteria bacterium ADurb.Bin341]|nr:MAG: Serine/threonine-protein kinase pkn1 [Betaproteobacteria bacterium ADurb.Bin341]
MTKIFVSYRRDESQEIAGRIARRLQERLGPGSILCDAGEPPLGVNIRKHFAERIGPCDVLLAIMGKHWLTPSEDGSSSLHEPFDCQRVAIESALAAGVPVVPVYVDGAARAQESDLPASLAELALLSGLSINDGPDFMNQMERLIRGINAFIRPSTGGAQAKADEAGSGVQAPAVVSRIEELRRAEREIRQNTRRILLARSAPPKAGGMHTLRDIPIAPELLIIPAGRFLMGSPESEAERRENEGPQHEVVIRRFAIGKFAVTFDEYDAYCRATGNPLPEDEGWGRGRRPVINVSWEDAQGYIQWLNHEARAELGDQYYRLPTEAEWEYVCRAGTTTPFFTGETISTDQANFDGNYSYGSGSKGRSLKATVEVGSYPPNPWGLYDMLGNTWEWVEDRFHDNYRGAPTDGSAWEIGKTENRVLRGGSWDSIPGCVRSAYRNMNAQGSCCSFDGFRIARTL